MSKNKKLIRKGEREISADANSYFGPVKSRFTEREEVDLHTETLHWVGDFSSTGASVMNASFGSSPTSAGDWSNFAAVYAECRVLGIEIHFVPKDRYSKSTTTCVPIVGVIDRTSSSPLSTYSSAYAYASARILSLEDPWSIIAHMQNAEESQFQAVGSIASLYWIKFYGDGLSVSTTYGKIFISYRVQFRGKA